MNSMNHPEELAGETLRGGGSFVAIAAGSGITPVIAMARTLLAANPETRFDLIYANKAAMDVMFLEELADLKDKYPTAAGHPPRAVPRAADRPAAIHGRIDAEKLQAAAGHRHPRRRCGRVVPVRAVRAGAAVPGHPGRARGEAGACPV